ncbi:glycosyltransferase family 2 protein [Christensenella tenuis]|uniref:Glycosyltransferase family 2 protein n=1 Tax=Christensenella tenuis TaxID=2763033 RepID=A0ABR7ECA7_9FIRM|nr:glycosyltransferase family 2 protein [Christensenella tenuis]MBC5647405.1 glycosyltransferase family 2 protein [Christensenella tenuis]
MNPGFEICKWIVIILSIYSAPIMIWMVITTLAGLAKPRALVPKDSRQYRFAVLVCARNEERVIGNLIDSLKKQDYSNYHIFVVADNCTDHTAHVAGACGATVFERFNEKKKGKGYALHFGINKLLREYAEDYDAVCIFDADNLASPAFLTEMNHALNAGADVALGYRDTKNIHDSWISEVYSIYWLMLQRFYYTSRHTLGFSSMVGGTGFAFKLSALGGEGWTTYSLTEDVEFSIQQILKGHKIIPARKAVFYDEQPAEYSVSVKQRFRWMVGGMQCIPLYFKQIMRRVFQGNLKALDLAWYILFIPATGLALPLNAASILMMLMMPGFEAFAGPVILALSLFNFGLGVLVAFLTLKLERRRIGPMVRGILLYPIFLLTMMFIALGALFRPHTEWVPIEHQSKYRIEDVDIS